MDRKLQKLIIISVDCLRADCVGANPDKYLLGKYHLKKKLKTPVFDKFAREGMFFTECITAAPYTTAAHASILTGLWPHNNGVIEFFRSGLKAPTVLEYLKNEGFATLFQADFHHILGPSLGFDRGIEKFVRANEQESLEWIRNNRGKKMACFFHFASVHSPYGFFSLEKGGDDYRRKLDGLMKKYGIKPDRRAKNESHVLAYDITAKDKVMKQNYLKVLEKMHSLKLYSEIMDLYMEGIKYFEKKRFAPFVSGLKRAGAFENSLVVIVGDHGECWDDCNQGHFRGSYQNGLAEDIIKVPLIFWGAGVPAGLCRRQVRTVDIVPTIMDLFGVGGKFDGQSLVPFGKHKEKAAFSQLWESDMKAAALSTRGPLARSARFGFLSSTAVRKQGWKLVENYSQKGKILKSRTFRISKGEIIRQNKAVSNSLSREAAIFNRASKKEHSTQKKVARPEKERVIAQQLRSLGYKI